MSALEFPGASCYACPSVAVIQCDVRNGTARCLRVACLVHSVDAALVSDNRHRCVQCHQLITRVMSRRREPLGTTGAVPPPSTKLCEGCKQAPAERTTDDDVELCQPCYDAVPATPSRRGD